MTEERLEDISVPLPDEAAMVYAKIGVVGYLHADGSQGYAVKTGGDAPSTAFLGLLFKVMMEIDRWSSYRD